MEPQSLPLMCVMSYIAFGVRKITFSPSVRRSVICIFPLQPKKPLWPFHKE